MDINQKLKERRIKINVEKKHRKHKLIKQLRKDNIEDTPDNEFLNKVAKLEEHSKRIENNRNENEIEAEGNNNIKKVKENEGKVNGNKKINNQNQNQNNQKNVNTKQSQSQSNNKSTRASTIPSLLSRLV